MLAECMRDRGGFDHNRQSLRVVELLETPYPNFPGLNLTFEVREGLQKHEVVKEFPAPAREEYHCSSLEAQVADLADEITYYSHDLDDAVDFEILSAAQLEENEVWRRSDSAVRTRYSGALQPELHKVIIRDIIDYEVNDLITASAKAIAESGAQAADDVRRQRAALIRYSNELAEANRALRKFLYENVYYHPRVAEVNRRACEMLRRVFEAYLVDPDRLGESATRRIETQGLHRTVCDYIAGMTDRYLMEEYERIAGSGTAC
jgi:dGTPase